MVLILVSIFFNLDQMRISYMSEGGKVEKNKKKKKYKLKKKKVGKCVHP